MEFDYTTFGKAVNQLLETMSEYERSRIKTVNILPDMHNYDSYIVWASFTDDKAYGYAAYINGTNGHIDVDGF